MLNQSSILRFVCVWSAVAVLAVTAVAQSSIPSAISVRILKAEDERRWDTDLKELLTDPSVAVRKRAALAVGRIGDEDSVSALAGLLQDANTEVRAMAAFAIGEVEAASGADPLLALLKNSEQPAIVRARTIEALGKIAGAMPREQEARRLELGAVILDAVKQEAGNPTSDRLNATLGLTAVLRSRPDKAGPVVAGFLWHNDARVRADAANTLARLRLKDGNEQLRKLLNTDVDPIVRANAARVLGATEDQLSFDPLLKHAIDDPDSRVRVSAIRSLALLKDERAAEPLLKRGNLLVQRRRTKYTPETNEALEIAATLGRLLAQKEDDAAIEWLRNLSERLDRTAPEVEIALIRVSPEASLKRFRPEGKLIVQRAILSSWRSASGIAAGLGEIAALPDSVSNKARFAAVAELMLRAMLDYDKSVVKVNKPDHPEYAVPDVLRALAAFKPRDLSEILLKHLAESDVIVRGTAADLLGDLPPSEQHTRALAAALPRTANDPLNDAALSILAALGKQKSVSANEAIRTALDSRDHLVRRRAVALLKANGAGDFSAKIGTVETRNTEADYRRALARSARKVRAVVTTTKGSFTMELLPEAAPLTVDNFVQLAQRSFFNGITIHRVVPNFVIQDGDPRGDGNGGPAQHQIRCEINEVPYDRAAVGMALSGKDTGGSQWFVTHSPQPHLDGGYTVFGRVTAGMNVVDNIVRGDVIKSIVIK
jgi:cyclophilin family peptidyl-prolyl cis-trans isomerase/HEAT repeat protein